MNGAWLVGLAPEIREQLAAFEAGLPDPRPEPPPMPTPWPRCLAGGIGHVVPLAIPRDGSGSVAAPLELIRSSDGGWVAFYDGPEYEYGDSFDPPPGPRQTTRPRGSSAPSRRSRRNEPCPDCSGRRRPLHLAAG